MQMTHKKTLTIIRGLPGVGKTTRALAILELAKKLNIKAVHAEADQFFTDPMTGEYVFKPEQIGLAHSECQAKVRHALKDPKVKLIVVSNTFVKNWEMEPYFTLAKEFGVDVNVIEATGGTGTTHGVPAETIERMRAQWQELPEDLKHLLERENDDSSEED